MKTIVAAIDFTDVTDEVLAAAKEMAVAFSAKLVILHTETPDFMMQEVVLDPYVVEQYLEKEARQDNMEVFYKTLEGIKETLQSENLDVECELLHGLAAQQISEETKRLNADLLVLGSHQHGLFYHMFVGGVEESIVHHIDCPVLIVPPVN